MKKRAFAFVLVFALCVVGALPGTAKAVGAEKGSMVSGLTDLSEPPVISRLSYTKMLDTQLSISSAKKAYISCSAVGYSGTTTKVEITATLEKKVLLWWSDVQTWSGVYYGLQGTLYKELSVASGKYRVKAVYKVYSGSSYETITAYSAEISC